MTDLLNMMKNKSKNKKFEFEETKIDGVKRFEKRETIEELLKAMENDYDFLKIMKSYEETQTNNGEKKEKNQGYKFRPEKSDKLGYLENNTIIFSNHIIQTSFEKINILKNIMRKQHNRIVYKYFEQWKNFDENAIHLKYASSNLQNLINYNSNASEAELPSKRGKIAEKSISTISLMNYLDNHSIFNPNLEMPLKLIEENHNNNEIVKSNLSVTKLDYYRILPTKFFIENLLKNIYNNFIHNCYNYINSRKSSNSSLSLLYLFTQLAITKNKLGNCGNTVLQKEELKEKLEESERKIAKYEACLNEKADIIASRNDRIEQQIETIELLTEEINRLNEKIEKLERKGKNLNIITESLCNRCGNTLEESFIKEPKTPRRIEDSYEIKELKKTIHEQLEFIVKIEKENRDLKLKNAESREKNEAILKELEEIKMEFQFISENHIPKDQWAQTENSSAPSTPSIHSKVNETPKKAPNSIKSHSKSKSNKYTNKLTLNKNTITETKTFENNTTNYNIININSNSKIVHSSNSNGSASINMSLTEIEKDALQTLRFDNAVLSQEILSINKELTKLKSENKSFLESTKKLEKEKSELSNKLKSKSENYDKYKKENEELMILIQKSNYKSFIASETENKKLKSENSLLVREVELIKEQVSMKDKKLNEIEVESEKLKKNLETFNKFKSERENLILENAKLESELKRICAELEDAKIILDKQNLILKNKEEMIIKMTEEINYLNFNAKKLKQEVERSVQDAIAYQQIVRKIEKDLKESQIRREKVENELMIIKRQLGLK